MIISRQHAMHRLNLDMLRHIIVFYCLTEDNLQDFVFCFLVLLPFKKRNINIFIHRQSCRLGTDFHLWFQSNCLLYTCIHLFVAIYVCERATRGCFYSTVFPFSFFNFSKYLIQIHVHTDLKLMNSAFKFIFKKKKNFWTRFLLNFLSNSNKHVLRENVMRWT